VTVATNPAKFGHYPRCGRKFGTGTGFWVGDCPLPFKADLVLF
jgi:hypothetical protein